MKNGKIREALLVLEETYIDPYVIANSIPDEQIKPNNEGRFLHYEFIT